MIINVIGFARCCVLFKSTYVLYLRFVITSEREARSEFLLIYTKNLSMSGPPARRPAGRTGRGHAFERLISLEP